MNGHIYILTHSRMPGLVKIGHTTTNVDQRIAEINAGAGVPGKFKVFYSFHLSDPQRVESVIHSKLRPFRHVTNKEFFELKPAVAREYVKRIIEDSEFGIQFDQSEMTIVSDTKRLGGLFKAHRKKKKMSQRDLAAAAGTGVRFIIEVEQGKPTAEIGKVLALLAALGLKVAVDSPDRST